MKPDHGNKIMCSLDDVYHIFMWPDMTCHISKKGSDVSKVDVMLFKTCGSCQIIVDMAITRRLGIPPISASAVKGKTWSYLLSLIILICELLYFWGTMAQCPFELALSMSRFKLEDIIRGYISDFSYFSIQITGIIHHLKFLISVREIK